MPFIKSAFIKKISLWLLLLLGITLYYPGPISAHPLDEIGDIKLYDQTQKLEVSPEKTKLTIDLTFYAIEKIKVWESIDTNKDQKLTEEEKIVWMNKGSNASWIEFGGTRIDFKAIKLNVPGYYDFFAPAPAKVSIEFTADLPVKSGTQLIYHYKGKDKPLEQITFEATGTDGLSVKDLEKIDSESSSFSVVEGTQSESNILGLKASGRLNQFLSKYVKVDKVPLKLAILAAFTAFMIGMLHALTPGHGKAIVAGYLVGEKGTVRQAIQLGLIITVTHTFSVFILGLAALFLTQYIVPVVLIKFMNTTSGILVTGFGLYLLITRLLKLRSQKNHADDHSEHLDDHDHHHSHDLELSWKNLIPLGISGGIVPCIDALAILIVAISLGKILFGIILLVLFSLGLASALIVGGIAVVFAKNKAVKKISKLEHYQKYISIASAVIVTILGLAILLGKPI